MSRTSDRWGAYAVIVIGCALLAGLAFSGRNDTPAATRRPTHSISGLRMIPMSLQDLAAESNAIVRFKATDQVRVVSPNGVHDTVTKVDVQEVLAGSVEGTQIEVRQVGSIDMPFEDGLPLLEAGKVYVAFLRGNIFEAEGPSPQYWPTSSSGLFSAKRNAPDKLVHLDPKSQLDQSALSLQALEGLVPGITVLSLVPASPR